MNALIKHALKVSVNYNYSAVDLIKTYAWFAYDSKNIVPVKLCKNDLIKLNWIQHQLIDLFIATIVLLIRFDKDVEKFIVLVDVTRAGNDDDLVKSAEINVAYRRSSHWQCGATDARRGNFCRDGIFLEILFKSFQTETTSVLLR